MAPTSLTLAPGLYHRSGPCPNAADGVLYLRRVGGTSRDFPSLRLHGYWQLVRVGRRLDLVPRQSRVLGTSLVAAAGTCFSTCDLCAGRSRSHRCVHPQQILYLGFLVFGWRRLKTLSAGGAGSQYGQIPQQYNYAQPQANTAVPYGQPVKQYGQPAPQYGQPAPQYAAPVPQQAYGQPTGYTQDPPRV